MSATADPGAEQKVPDVSRLIVGLRKARFQVGVSEAADATRLLLELSHREPALKDPSALCNRLRPILCKSRERQPEFDDIFEEWLKYRAGDAHPNAPGAHGSKETTKKDEEAEARRREAAARRQRDLERQRRRYVVFATVMITLGLLLYRFLPRPEIVLLPDEAPVAVRKAGIPPSTPYPAPSAESFDRYVPELRYNKELRASWAWLLLLLPAAAFFGVSLPAMALSRSRLRRNADPMYLNSQPLAAAAQRLVPPLRPDIADRLARHLYSSGLDIERLARRPVLDVRGTVEGTLRNDGIPKLRFSHSRVHPSYLLLVDAMNERDPRGRFFFQWAERMIRQGLDVEVLLVRSRRGPNNSTAVEFVPPGKHGIPGHAWLPLPRLRAPRFGERLILVSDGSTLVDAAGNWHEAALRAHLSRWRERVIFTPVEPRDWSLREERMERREQPADPGFIVLPLEESALAAWTDLISSGQLSRVELADPQRFPLLLRKGPVEKYLGATPPEAETLEKLISQLRVYLGQWGFYWLAACAVPPLVRWELTLMLGEEILKGLPPPARDSDVAKALSRYYRRLVKLPWMQRESLPEWLRLRLLMELPSKRHQQLQQIVRTRLGALQRQAGPGDIELNFERPLGDSTAMPGTSARNDTGTPGGDALYLGYVSGLTPDQLVLRAPREWAPWMSKIRLKPPQGLRGWLTRVRDHTSAWWARLAWTHGLPHLGTSRRGLLIALCLSAPLLLCLVAFLAFPRDVSRLPQGWLFVDRARPIALIGGYLRAIALTRDGSRAAAFGLGSLSIYDVRSGQLLVSNLDFSVSTLPTLAFSADDRLLAASAPSDPGLRVFDALTLKVIAQREYDDQARAHAFTEDGRALLIVGTKNLYRWEFENAPGEIATLALPGLADSMATSSAVAITHDASRIVVMHEENIEQWDIRTGERFAVPSPLTRPIMAMASGPGTSRIVIAGANGVLRLLDVRTGRFVGEPLPHPRSKFSGLAVSADGSRLATAHADGLSILNAHAARIVHETPVTEIDASGGLAYSLDGARLAVGAADGAVQIWDARLAEPVGGVLRSRHGLIRDLALSPDGDRLVICPDRGPPQLWNLATRTQVALAPAHATQFHSVLFSPDAARIVSGSDAGLVMWNASDGAVRPQGRTVQSIKPLAFNKTGTMLVSIDDSERLWLLDGRTGRPIATFLTTQTAGTVRAAFSADGTRLVSGHFDGSIRLWDVARRHQIRQLTGHRSAIISIGFTQDDARIISAGLDSSVRVWDAQSGEPVGSPQRLPRLRHMALHPQLPHFVTSQSTATDANPTRPQPSQGISSKKKPALKNKPALPGRLAFWRVDPPDLAASTTLRLLGKERLAFKLLNSSYAAACAIAFVLALAFVPGIRRRRAIGRVLANSRQPT